MMKWLMRKYYSIVRTEHCGICDKRITNKEYVDNWESCNSCFDELNSMKNKFDQRFLCDMWDRKVGTSNSLSEPQKLDHEIKLDTTSEYSYEYQDYSIGGISYFKTGIWGPTENKKVEDAEKIKQKLDSSLLRSDPED